MSLEKETKEMKRYELGFLVKTEEDAALIKKILAKNKAEISEEGPVVKVNLAYPIKKASQAFFGYFRWSAAAEILADIEKELKLASQVLRYLLIKSPRVLAPAKRVSFGSRSFVRKRETEPARKTPEAGLSNEALEKKIEEILNA